ncbi:MAG: hypothetical protein ACREUA_10005 [Burkholderiales bacterium]
MPQVEGNRSGLYLRRSLCIQHCGLQGVGSAVNAIKRDACRVVQME